MIGAFSNPERRFLGDPLIAIATFKHRLSQLFDEQRHAVGALDDVVDDLTGETGIACEPVDQRSAIVHSESMQRQDRHMRLIAPGVLKFRAESDYEQDRQPRQPLNREVKQLA
jgi:hypothetical protein